MNKLKEEMINEYLAIIYHTILKIKLLSYYNICIYI